MSFQFRADHSRNFSERFYKVVIPTPGTDLHVVVANDPDTWKTADLHFDVGLNRQVPCRGDACKLCPSPIRVVTYVPVLLVRGPMAGRSMKAHVIPVTDGYRKLLDEDHFEHVFKVFRTRANTSASYSIAGKMAAHGITPWKGVDIAPTLLRLWGIREPHKAENN